MCIFCGGQCGGIGEFLAPLIGIGGAMAVVKIESRIRVWKQAWKRSSGKRPAAGKH